MLKFLALFTVLMITSCEEADNFDELIAIVENKLNIVDNGACVGFMGHVSWQFYKNNIY